MSPEGRDDQNEPNPLKILRALVEAGTGGVQQLAENVRVSIERFQQSDALAVARRIVDEWAPKAAAVMATMMEAYDWLMPPNWRELTVPEAIAVSDLMAEEGWGLVWVPSPSVLRALLEAPDIEARKTALVGMEGQVLADLDLALTSVDRPELAELVWGARQAVETYTSGHWAGAQALAAAGLSTVIEAHFGLRFKEAREQWERPEDPEEREMLDFRLTAVTGAIRRALDQFRPLEGEKPPHFNRHATAHRLERPQYSEANSLAGVMLFVCAVCELDWIAAGIERQQKRLSGEDLGQTT